MGIIERGDFVIGIDNINDYYSKVLKKRRLDQLIEHDNFSFHRSNISNKDDLDKIFNEFKPHKVVNLAAQAGVRYSLKTLMPILIQT